MKCGLLLGLALAFPVSAFATPQHSARAVAQCNTCHIEPVSWKNPETKFRKCSLDCSVCHTSSTGGGLRNASGQYFGLESLSTWGRRPGSHGNPEKYRSEDDKSSPGIFRLWKGFSGWWPGPQDVDEIKDRYGNISPDPRFRIGGDFRAMSWQPYGKDAPKPATFPMQADVYLMGKATDHIAMYTSLGYLGRARRKVVPADEDDPEHIRRETYKTLVAAREAFVKVEGSTYGTYVRAGRFNKPHGWRLPDHTSFVRRELGFDQNSQVFGVEAGIVPNYPYANIALFYQGSDDWPGDVMQKGYGTAITGGYRALAGQAGFSLEVLQTARTRDATTGTYDHGAQSVLGGPVFSLNAYPVIYVGEVDFRTRVDDRGTLNSLYSYNEIDVFVFRGVNVQLKYDWLDRDIRFKDDHAHRYTAGVEWNPVNHLQLVVQHRWTVPGNRNLGRSQDWILMTHAWF